MHRRRLLALGALLALLVLISGCQTPVPAAKDTVVTETSATVPAVTDTASPDDLVTVPNLLLAVSEWVTRTQPDPHDPKWSAKAIKAIEPETAPLGLKVRITWAKSEDEGMYQRPQTGERVPRGTTVELHLIGEL